MRGKYPAIVLLSAAAACSGAVKTGAVKTRNIKDLPGWTVQKEPETHHPENLWNAINGAAEIHMAFGFQELTSYEYKQTSKTISLEIYDQGNPLNAFGIFQSERPPNGATMDDDSLAFFAAPFDCIFALDRYYIKATALEGELDRQLCRDLVEHASRSLPGKAGLPPEFASLPVSGRVRGTEGFSKKSHLGLAELTNCVFAAYTHSKGEKPVQIFALLSSREDTVETTWTRIKSEWQPIELGGAHALVREIPYRGNVYLIKTEKGLFGVADAETAEIAGHWVETLRKAR